MPGSHVKALTPSILEYGEFVKKKKILDVIRYEDIHILREKYGPIIKYGWHLSRN